jgi:hypothetical protein
MLAADVLCGGKETTDLDLVWVFQTRMGANVGHFVLVWGT